MVTPVKFGTINPKIASFVNSLLKERKEDIVFNLEDFKTDDSFVPTDLVQLDYLVLGGGLARGRIYEIFGSESSGKTTLALQIAANIQKIDKERDVLFLDSENALDRNYAESLGVDLSRVWVCQPDYGEQGLSVMEQLLKSGYFSLLIVDSVAALTPKSIIEGDMEDKGIGVQARLMTQVLGKLTHIVNENKIIVLFTNQIRAKIGVLYGSKETTPGGNALKHYASVRLELTVTGKIKDVESGVAGNKVRIKAVKNKLFPPFREVELELFYGRGFSKESSLLSFALDLGLVQKNGAVYEYAQKKYKGWNELLEVFIQDKELYNKLLQEIREKSKKV